MSSSAMRVLSIRPLREFWEKHPESEVALKRWFRAAEQAHWERWADVKTSFPQADLVPVHSGVKMAVFNVGGNKYRVVAHVPFREGGWMFVKCVLVHSEYSRDRWKEEL
jgi:mRNA interferase HigB